MNIERQVCSLPLAQRLKKLGVKQDSLFYWYKEKTNEAAFKDAAELGIMRKEPLAYDKPEVCIYPMHDCYYTHFDPKSCTKVSAFTVAELGEMLPTRIQIPYLEVRNGGYTELCAKRLLGSWKYWYANSGPANYHEEAAVDLHDRATITAESEADARAKMLIYLIENKLTPAN